jgi:hypothetical protein
MKAVSQYSGWNLYSSDCLEAKVNQQIVERFLEIDENGKFLNPPKNEDELEVFVELFYGVRFPKKVITPGHKSPWQFLCDLYFERVKKALGFANRSGGKTYLVAVLNHLDMLFKWGCEVSSAGAVKDQAQRCYKYFTELNQLPAYQEFCKRFGKVTGRRFLESSIQSKTKFGNGAELEIITGSEKGFRGPHPQKSRIDEIDELEWDVFQTGLSMSKSTNEISGQDVFTSTRQKEQGTMDRLIEEADRRRVKIYEWNIWETLERCPRRCINDPVHGTCPVVKFCNGQAHDCDGYYRIEDFIEKVTGLDEDKFAREWVNKGASRERLVYHHFKKEQHVLDPDKLFKLTGFRSPSLEWTRVSGLDFGSSPGNPFVYLKLVKLPFGGWLVWWEYYAEQRLLRDHAWSIKNSPGYSMSEQIYGDWDAQDRLELAQYGIRMRPAVKGPDSVAVGIDKINEYLQGYAPYFRPHLYVWHECVNTIYEFTRYQWPVRADGRPDKSGRPRDGYDHAMDSMRYAVFSDYRLGAPKYFARRVSGI